MSFASDVVASLRSALAATAEARASAQVARSTTASRPFKPMRSDPDKRDEIKPYVGLDYAVATLWDQHGRRVLGPHSAADDGPAATANWNRGTGRAIDD